MCYSCFQHGKAFYEKTALGSLPQVMLNGVPFTKSEVGIIHSH